MSTPDISSVSSSDNPPSASSKLVEYFPAAPGFSESTEQAHSGRSAASHPASFIVCPECGTHITTGFHARRPHASRRQHNGASHTGNTPQQLLIEPPAIVRDANYFKLLEGFTPVAQNGTANSDQGSSNPGDDESSSSSAGTNLDQQLSVSDVTESHSTESLADSTDATATPSEPAVYSSISDSAFSQGYFDQFFKVKGKLGQGSRGAVYLVEHMLDGYSLGLFALKKVPVGNDHKWLEKVLAEVHLLRLLSHPNLVNYNHMWLESSHISRFAPVVPCAFILQEYCDGGTLEDYVRNLQSDALRGATLSSKSAATPQEAANLKAKERFRRQSEARFGDRSSNAALLRDEILKAARLTLDEILSFSRDIFSGIVHLHQAQVIHRDLKPSNCLLLTSEKQSVDGMARNRSVSLSSDDVDDSSDESDGDEQTRNKGGDSNTLKRKHKLPTVLVSDFGEGQLEGLLRTGTGTTGTLEYCAPELIKPLVGTPELDSSGGKFAQFSKKTDMFSLGMILHFLCFSRLPYSPVLIDGVDAESLDRLTQEVLDFRGFDASKISPGDERDDLPPELYTLLTRLLSTDPDERPSATECLNVIETLLRAVRYKAKADKKAQAKSETVEPAPTVPENRAESTEALPVLEPTFSSLTRTLTASSDDSGAVYRFPHATIRLITDRSLADARSMDLYSSSNSNSAPTSSPWPSSAPALADISYFSAPFSSDEMLPATSSAKSPFGFTASHRNRRHSSVQKRVDARRHRRSKSHGRLGHRSGFGSVLFRTGDTSAPTPLNGAAGEPSLSSSGAGGLGTSNSFPAFSNFHIEELGSNGLLLGGSSSNPRFRRDSDRFSDIFDEGVDIAQNLVSYRNPLPPRSKSIIGYSSPRVVSISSSSSGSAPLSSAGFRPGDVPSSSLVVRSASLKRKHSLGDGQSDGAGREPQAGGGWEGPRTKLRRILGRYCFWRGGAAAGGMVTTETTGAKTASSSFSSGKSANDTDNICNDDGYTSGKVTWPDHGHRVAAAKKSPLSCELVSPESAAAQPHHHPGLTLDLRGSRTQTVVVKAALVLVKAYFLQKLAGTENNTQALTNLLVLLIGIEMPM